MKKEAGVIFIVAVFSAVLSIILSGIFFSTPEDRTQKVEVVSPITTTFQDPGSVYFNSNSVNPVQNIQIGTEPNSKPLEAR
jgi:hypothetical protein